MPTAVDLGFGRRDPPQALVMFASVVVDFFFLVLCSTDMK